MSYFLLHQIDHFWTYALFTPHGKRMLRGPARRHREEAVREVANLRRLVTETSIPQSRTTPGGSFFFSYEVPGKPTIATSNYFDSVAAANAAAVTAHEIIRGAPLVEDRVNRVARMRIAVPQADVETVEVLCCLESLGAGFFLTVRGVNGHALLATLPTPTRSLSLGHAGLLQTCGAHEECYSHHLSDLGQFSFRLRNAAGEPLATSGLYQTAELRDEKLKQCLLSIRTRTTMSAAHPVSED